MLKFANFIHIADGPMAPVENSGSESAAGHITNLLTGGLVAQIPSAKGPKTLLGATPPEAEPKSHADILFGNRDTTETNAPPASAAAPEQKVASAAAAPKVNLQNAPARGRRVAPQTTATPGHAKNAAGGTTPASQPLQGSGNVPNATPDATGGKPRGRRGRLTPEPRRPGVQAAGSLPVKDKPVARTPPRQRGTFSFPGHREELERLVVAGRKRGHTLAASNLEHYLGASGIERKFNPDWLRRNYPIVKETERRVEGHFENWLTGKLIPTEQQEIIGFDKVRNLKDGDRPITVTSEWEGKIRLGAVGQGINRVLNEVASNLFPVDPVTDDLTYATGESAIVGTGTIDISRVNGVLRFTGMVAMQWDDTYNFDRSAARVYNPDTKEVVFTTVAMMRVLEKNGEAAQFPMSSTWTRKVEGTLRKTKVGWALENVKWTESRKSGRPGGDPAR